VAVAAGQDRAIDAVAARRAIVAAHVVVRAVHQADREERDGDQHARGADDHAAVYSSKMPPMKRAASWMAPSVAGALGATIAAALIDALTHVDADGERGLRVVVAAGYAVALAAPLAFALALLARGIVAAWQPRALVARLTDAQGAAPGLAGGLGGGLVGLGLLALASNQLVWLLARVTAFKPRTLAVVVPALMLVVGVAVVLVSGAIAIGLGRWLRQVRWRRGLTPRRLLGAAAALLTIGLGLAWLLVVRPLVRQLSLDGGVFTAIVAVLLIFAHIAWPHLPARRAVLGALGALAIALVGTAVWASQARPTLILTLWGDGGVGALAVDLILDIDAVRASVPAADLAPRPRPGARHPDVVLLTIDTFRPDRLAIYGGPVAAPALTSLAARGTLFETAIAPSNVTRRSIPALVTGVAPTRVRGRVSGWALRLDPRHVTLAERLRASGYDTIGLFCCEGFWSRTRPTGLERGFTELVVERDASALVAAARARLAVRAPDSPPLYLWLHFIELHEWAGGDPDLRPERRRLYDDSLARIDGEVGGLLAALATLPPGRAPIVIVTGDHGEALGDHGEPFHSTDLYNSQIQVPLVVAGPGIAARRVDEVVSLLDLVPTVLDLAGFEPPGHPILDGRSLADLLTGRRDPDTSRGRAYAAMVVDRFVRTGPRTLILGQWKLIHHGDSERDELYDLASDPRELSDRATREPDQLLRMRAALFAQQLRDRASPFAR